ncbi:hypothetical protein ACIBG6_19465 [Streptomyces sp. NPDC050842]
MIPSISVRRNAKKSAVSAVRRRVRAERLRSVAAGLAGLRRRDVETS